MKSANQSDRYCEIKAFTIEGEAEDAMVSTKYSDLQLERDLQVNNFCSLSGYIGIDV